MLLQHDVHKSTEENEEGIAANNPGMYWTLHKSFVTDHCKSVHISADALREQFYIMDLAFSSCERAQLNSHENTSSPRDFKLTYQCVPQKLALMPAMRGNEKDRLP